MRNVSKPKESRGRVRFLSDEERARLLDACRASDNPSIYPAVVLALPTGARKMEILKLTWRDVDFQRQYYTRFVHQVTAEPIPVSHALERSHFV